MKREREITSTSEEEKDVVQQFNDEQFCWRHPVWYDVNEGCPLCRQEEDQP